MSDYFTSADTTVTRVAFSRRNTRRYVHVRIDVADVRRLARRRPSTGRRTRSLGTAIVMIYRQTVGRVGDDITASVTRWQGDEVVAFRVHVPSKVVYHNVDRVRRGNILAWEQPLTRRLAGVPLELEARMETQSILYRTLWLFGAALLAVAAMFALIIWRVVKRSARHPLPASSEVDVIRRARLTTAAGRADRARRPTLVAEIARSSRHSRRAWRRRCRAVRTAVPAPP